jgi:hypothetical protein
MTIRREFLASVGAAIALAGCSSTQNENGASTEPPTATTTAERTTDATPATEPPTENVETDEPQEVETDLNVSIDQAGWLEEGATAEFIVSNREEVPIIPLEFIADWYDEEGNFIDWDRKITPALGTSKTWYLHMTPSTDRSIKSFEAVARGIPRERNIPDGVEIQSKEVANSQVRGIISNTQDSETGISVIATVYDSGWLTHYGTTTQSRIPAGADWNFNISIRVADANVRPPGNEIVLYISRTL